MIDDARLGKLLVQSGILSKDDLDRLKGEQGSTKPPTSLFQLVVTRGLASEERVREVVARADQYSETKVTSSKIGKFELRGELGRGGMGIVYRAWQPDLQRTVALKVIAAGTDPAFKERFLREARVASRLRHPNIVAVYEYGEEAGSAFFSMDYVKGESFDAALKGRSLGENVGLLSKIARALHHAHAQGLVHRDIKPQNILVADDGTPFLTDFGLAREANAQSPLTVTGQILGTPAFMSPEQARGGKGELGPASDVYSLGAVIYIVLTGRPPFRADSVYDLLDSIIKTPPAPPRSLDAKVPAPLEAVCLRCLEKDPARRYASAEALAEDLDRWLAGKPVEARVPVPANGRRRSAAVGKTPSRRRPLFLAASAAAAAILIVGIVLQQMPGDPHPPPLTASAPGPGPEPGLPEVPVEPAWFASPPKPAGKGWVWNHAFSNRRAAMDWQVNPGISRGVQPYEVRFESDGLRLRNVELRFLAPLEGAAKFSAIFSIPTAGSNHGISLGGWRLIRAPDAIKLVSPSLQPVSKPTGAIAGAESLELEIGPGWIAGRVNGNEAIREPLPESAPPLRPAVFAQEETTIVCRSAALQGSVRAAWAAAHRETLREFGKVGKEYRVEAAQDLLAGGGAGRFKNEGGGTPEPEAGGVRFRLGTGKPIELHGPNVRTSRLRLKYSHPGGSLTLRFRAGYREVTVPLPCGGPEEREIEIVALEDRIRCVVDGALDVDSSMANGTDLDHITIRLKAGGGDLLLRAASLEPIGNIPPRPPWTMLFHGGAEQGLAKSGSWAVRNGLLGGEGELRAPAAWRDLEAEVIVAAQKDARMTFGARGIDVLSGRPVAMYDGGFSGFTFRVRGRAAELENDLTFFRRAVPEGTGPLTIRVEGAPVQIFSLRARPLP